MPALAITVTADIADMPPYAINQELIMGAANLKTVYSFFPTDLVGVVYFFHGTGGSAAGWIDNVENRSLVNAAIADSFGVVITEAEEITLDDDTNGDGKLRWDIFPLDTISGVDYLNIKALTDTFIARGSISSGTPITTVGMSNGGAFSSAISAAYDFRAGVSYCAPSQAVLFQLRQNPFAFRMASYDDNAEVGQEGNYEAFQHDSILADREICHDYLLHDRQPIYPQRFARVAGISVATSETIFGELVANGRIGTDGYALPSLAVATDFQSNPLNYPLINSLTLGQKFGLVNQLGVANAEHKFYSDYNQETLSFLKDLCRVITRINDIQPVQETKIMAYPNPFTDRLKLTSITENETYTLSSGLGQIQWAGIRIEEQNFNHLEAGIYYLTIHRGDASKTVKLIKAGH